MSADIAKIVELISESTDVDMIERFAVAGGGAVQLRAIQRLADLARRGEMVH